MGLSWPHRRNAVRSPLAPTSVGTPNPCGSEPAREGQDLVYQVSPATSRLPYLFCANAAPAIITTKIPANTSDEPTVPKSRPPFSWGLVRKSPNVAPNGRVSTNATQNSSTDEIFVKYLSKTTTAMVEPINSAPPAKPRPESSAR